MTDYADSPMRIKSESAEILKQSKVVGDSFKLQSPLYYLDGKFYIAPVLGREVREITLDFAREQYPDSFDERGNLIT